MPITTGFVYSSNARFDGNVNFPVTALPITTVFVYLSTNARYDGNVNIPVPAVPITSLCIFGIKCKI